MAEEPPDKPSAHFEQTYREGILVTVIEEKDDVLHAQFGEGVLLTPLSSNDAKVYDAAERLMRKFRSWELEDSKGLDLAEQVSKERVSKLRAEGKEMTRELLAEEPGLGNAVIEMIGEGGEGWQLWVLVASWFEQVGEGWRVEKEEMWCVD